MMARMLGTGKGCSMQSGSYQCDCCNVPAGKGRRATRRYLKRSERGDVKRQISRGLTRKYTD